MKHQGPLLRTFANEAQLLDAPSAVLDGEIFKAFEELPGDVWDDGIGEEGVWHREDANDRGAWDGPKPLTESLDAVLAFKPGYMRIIGLKEFIRTDVSGPKWRSCGCEVESKGYVFKATASSLARALLGAILQAVAFEQDASSAEARPSISDLIANPDMARAKKFLDESTFQEATALQRAAREANLVEMRQLAFKRGQHLNGEHRHPDLWS